ncbi:hypothetical protein PCCS19_02560 [Paenibacillus sp. CCS19]|uniref:hypothetical protein n=1 Tax=Paenibacillus sp. CCS19 TaxID=3158387 RepID=UPI002569D065|nr:hypothetical protein [Paenibacillus cellulosilyticus]GMK37203.1 hypothetical protein PCCS19_02560 [Paenibacillus cellulosilyticus]
MKLRMTVCILVMVAIISGCSGGGDEVSSKMTLDGVTATAVTEGEKAESLRTLEDVTTAMENQGLKLLQIHPKGGTSIFATLNGVDAVTYAIDTYAMGDVTDEVSSSLSYAVNVYVYVFGSDNARIEGQNALNDILARAKFAAAPSVFVSKNILVIHFNSKGENEQYDHMIQSAVDGL